MILGKSSTYRLGDKDVSVREMVVSEIAALLDGMDDYKPHILDFLLASEIPVSAVITSTGLSEEELLAIPCSELEVLYKEVQKVNPHLDALTERLRSLVEKHPEILSGKRPVNS